MGLSRLSDGGDGGDGQLEGFDLDGGDSEQRLLRLVSGHERDTSSGFSLSFINYSDHLIPRKFMQTYTVLNAF